MKNGPIISSRYNSVSYIPSGDWATVDEEGHQALFMIGGGNQAVQGHEGRRVGAMKIAYYAYLAPSQLEGEYATRCGVVCRCTPGAAKSELENYLKRLRQRAMVYYDVYNRAQQSKIDAEKLVTISIEHNYGIAPLYRYENIAEFDPVDKGLFKMTPPECPRSE